MDKTFITFIFLALIPLVLALAVGYAVVSYQFGHKVAAKQLLIVLVCLVAAIGILCLMSLMSLLSSEWVDLVWSGFSLLISLGIWIFLVIRMRQIAWAGDVMMEIGRPPTGCVNGIAGTILIIVGLGCIAGAIGNHSHDALYRWSQLFTGILLLSIAICILYLWQSIWSIRERGIMLSSQLLAWERIKAFQWDRDKHTTLVLKVKSRFPWSRTGFVRIPVEQQEAVTELLERYISPSTEGGSAG